jgi:hypothetical protein
MTEVYLHSPVRNSGATETEEADPRLQAKWARHWNTPVFKPRGYVAQWARTSERHSEPTTAKVRTKQLMSPSALRESKPIKSASEETDGTNSGRCFNKSSSWPPPAPKTIPWPLERALEGPCIIQQCISSRTVSMDGYNSGDIHQQFIAEHSWGLTAC